MLDVDVPRWYDTREAFSCGGVSGKVIVVSGPQSTSVTFTVGRLPVATASADQVEPGEWWVSRCLVSEGHRGGGLGGLALGRLQAEVSRQAGFERMVVAPGGYGSSPRRVRRFYARHGFRPYPKVRGMMVWRPGSSGLVTPERSDFQAAFRARSVDGVLRLRGVRQLDAVYPDGDVDLSETAAWRLLHECIRGQDENHEMLEVGTLVLDALGLCKS